MASINMAAGIGLRSSFEILCKQLGGERNVGCSKVDIKNFLNKFRQKKLVFGEESAINEYFRAKTERELDFFWATEMDLEERMANIFWADSRMRDDYACFGDSITFDTTYRTNDKCRPLALFVGFNNHHQSVIFGACLMYDETAESFQWLFRTFLRCMKGKKPETIFTDQDAAMAEALREEMPDVFHGLCTFHILQNAKKNLGSLFTQEFVRRLLLLFYNVDTVQDFDCVWAHMIKECFPGHGASGHRWCDYILRFRTQWSSAWVMNHYTAGMVSTQLVESCNAVVRGFLKANISMIDFFPHFER
ncbi:Protein FAR1-RELATED SEQUENCE 5 [Linum perenne]